MGLAIPRPAMRNREARIISARLAFFVERLKVLMSEGMDKNVASKQANIETRNLKFTRAGTLKKKQGN
jgi:hypothetical protein